MAKTKHEEREELIRCTIFLEEEHIEALDELAKEFSKNLAQKWTRSAVVRLAVGNFLTNMKKMT
ncbi:MAG: hypothetical protein A3G39_07985 [Deltaproteobacteria bacterium RIFCSPLOWO2_12_FULL_43_16]|nr:MAG: hypothetical protein A2Z89_02735 [Deltaproteobacteria bacterium GWA2_43_19]OGQ12312.1 MAG: hypothetical protein A3D30_03415 [Deltaproteobacteria bacterium RIFCSPHIGHO2_02_FULL_43_33]OGQ39168.1 MAG: hypothetical protein A3A85_03465 [Deltaproteobacteria bacterium RIFCSPLOWO2_01_FULL_42_9]OGQ57260.1 MAG: hypothetical protein A3G39_07985 [Deltaproteobacteria bacterium RIFCSPLOWO2_12_FULL_43_16]HBR17036.1 hypothetical protein [Deltaproteobacteria bacterium]